MEKTAAATGEQPQAAAASLPRYKGVRLRKWGSWVAEVRFPNSRERLWLGSYPTAEKAARAFDAAVYCLRGPDAAFNFPDRPPSNIIPSPVPGKLMSKEEIRAAAMRYANEEELTPPAENTAAAVGKEEGSSRTMAEAPAEELPMERYSNSAAAVAPELWKEEEEEEEIKAWDAASVSDDDIYSSSPLWNF